MTLHLLFCVFVLKQLTPVFAVQGQFVAVSAHHRPSPLRRRRTEEAPLPGVSAFPAYSSYYFLPKLFQLYPNAAMTESILIRSSGISQQKVLLNGQCMIVVIMSKSRKLRINPSNTKLPWISCLLMIYSVTLPDFSHKSFLLYFFLLFPQTKQK